MAHTENDSSQYILYSMTGRRDVDSFLVGRGYEESKREEDDWRQHNCRGYHDIPEDADPSFVEQDLIKKFEGHVLGIHLNPIEVTGPAKKLPEEYWLKGSRLFFQEYTSVENFIPVRTGIISDKIFQELVDIVKSGQLSDIVIYNLNGRQLDLNKL